MVLSAETRAALDRSRAALSAAAAKPTDVAADDDRPDLPLRWTGERYSRHPHDRQMRDAMGDDIPPAQVAPGWWVWSVSQTWAAEGSPVERQGVCVDVVPDDDAEPVYVCVEQFRSGIYRLDIAAADVMEAVVATKRDLASLRRTLHTALGHGRGRLRAHVDARWLEGVALTVGGLADG